MDAPDLDKAIRKVPDFPHEGILFYDITGVLNDPAAFGYCIDEAVRRYSGKAFGAVAGVEARGFAFAAPIALRLGLPLILVRKKGKLPGETISEAFDLEYGKAVVEIQPVEVPGGAKVLLVDDLIATGGTLKAAMRLFERVGAKVTDIFAVIGLPFLNFSDQLTGVEIQTLLDYAGE
ncbi:MAG: adenine phosphoribosyltransferase [Spirochaetaceae bacterium]